MKTVLLSSAAAFALSFAVPTGALAQNILEDPISAEILPGWDLKDGRRVVGLRLTLEPGWKTYWRAPGDAGIPPQFDWSKARNVQNVDLTWPTPEIHIQHGVRSIGYDNVVTIPMTITPKQTDRPVRLRARMNLGVCAEVCVPHSLGFDEVVFEQGSTRAPAIAAAFADTPYSEDEAGVVSAVCAIRPSTHGMEISAKITMPYTGGKEVAVIEPGQADMWVSEADTKRSGNVLTATAEIVHHEGGPFSVNRSDVRITVLGGEYAVDVQGCTGS